MNKNNSEGYTRELERTIGEYIIKSRFDPFKECIVFRYVCPSCGILFASSAHGLTEEKRLCKRCGKYAELEKVSVHDFTSNSIYPKKVLFHFYFYAVAFT